MQLYIVKIRGNGSLLEGSLVKTRAKTLKICLLGSKSSQNAGKCNVGEDEKKRPKAPGAPKAKKVSENVIFKLKL